MNNVSPICHWQPLACKGKWSVHGTVKACTHDACPLIPPQRVFTQFEKAKSTPDPAPSVVA